MDKPINEEDAQDESGGFGGFSVEEGAGWSPGAPSRSTMETLATHVAESLRLGDADYRAFKSGFAIKELVSPAKAKQKREQEPDNLPQPGYRLKFDGGPQTPLKKQTTEEQENIIPERQEGVPCGQGNENPRQEEILSRWEKKLREGALDEWSRLGYESPRQMEQAIKETLPCTRNEAPQSAWSYRRNWQYDGAYPLEKGAKFEPVGIEECRQILD